MKVLEDNDEMNFHISVRTNEACLYSIKQIITEFMQLGKKVEVEILQNISVLK